MLIVATSSRTPSGTYRLRVRAGGGGLQSTTVVLLRVRGAAGGGRTTPVTLSPYSISGDVTDPLEPGTPRGIDLTVTNPFALPLRLTGLSVKIRALSAPRATPALPCTAADFSVQQYSGAYPVVIPALSARSLEGLGIPVAAWPQVAIVDRTSNQDGCQGASVTLAYDALARLG